MTGPFGRCRWRRICGKESGAEIKQGRPLFTGETLELLDTLDILDTLGTLEKSRVPRDPRGPNYIGAPLGLLKCKTKIKMLNYVPIYFEHLEYLEHLEN